MAQRSSTTAGRTLDRFRYTPGDGHVYVWRDGLNVIKVFKIGTVGKVMTFTPTGDTIPAPAQATATALAAAVALWRDGRVTGEDDGS